MKYFRYILMGYEIFLKTFNGPQTFIFPIFLETSFKKLALGVCAQNAQTGH